jgi:hypothetical protein
LREILEKIQKDGKDILDTKAIKELISLAEKEWLLKIVNFKKVTSISGTYLSEVIVNVKRIRFLNRGEGQPTADYLFVVEGNAEKNASVCFVYSLIISSFVVKFNQNFD